MRTNRYLVCCPFPPASGSGFFPGLSVSITLDDRQTRGVGGPGTGPSTSCNLLTVFILQPMPPNHRSFLSQFIPLFTFPISICCLPTLYFSFSSPSPHVTPVPLHSILLMLFLCLCKSSLPLPIHHHRSHPELVLFLLLLTCFHSPDCSHSIIHAPSSAAICQRFSFAHSFITPPGLHLSPILSDIPGRLYFTQPARPQVGIAVLVRAGVGVKAVWDGVLWERPNGTDGGEVSGRAKLNFDS